MRRLLLIALAVFMLVGAAGQALATTSFGELDLVRVVYKAGDKEVATNLGTIGTDITLADIGHTVGGGSSAVQLSYFAPGTTWADLSVAYYAKVYSTKDVWLSSTSATAPAVDSRKFATFNGGVGTTLVYYSALPNVGDTVVGDTGSMQSYYINCNSSAIGSFVGYYKYAPYTGEANLAALDSGGFVDMYLYHYLNNVYTGESAILRLFADGSSVINPAAVPLPGTMLLMGAGLLGLLGFRRRENA